MRMTLDEAIEVLSLRSGAKGPQGKIKNVNPFAEANKAEKVWRQSASRIGYSVETLERDMAIAHADEQIMQAWEMVANHLWCKQCQCICLVAHEHCERCGGIVRRQEKGKPGERIDVTFTCMKCRQQDWDIID